ncbi:MAG: apolipoprotein N-acyltransferase [Candidatus Marinimicrobia bacterium]|jgi:apolipoprotein N-acyltransferase|nr:apolipoprotein N-acyltransferase [Gammaproteobacteria bacterium]MBL6911453.1 apolipoprotein N-acyltransferase [Candidatus Neomarinimicrobiota bacterium]MBT3728007.1 apolipoprotein N-acyltransferase [Candidatus Neomarinimicrobiota bacterium]MBT3944140.1 apolipoprotein N-acyltransferase [Candidatus Neomarinimicrobiota bacterium]MBT4111704.1 apolipoprotein N-acyltransferase [Candidatus Neomarinimicrobiota bacterium]
MKIDKLILPIVSGLLLGLAYPPFNFGFLAWVAFIPLFYSTSKEKKISQKLLFAFIACLVSNLIILNWMGLNSGTSAVISIISYLALSLYLTLFWMAFIVSIHFIPKKMELVLIPFSWIFFVEFLRNIGPLAGPWMNLSLTQSGYIRIIQLASIETHAISFFVILFNLILYKYFVDKKTVFFRYFILILFSVLLFGSYNINHQNNRLIETSVNISIGQPSIFPDEKWNPNLRLRNLAIMDSLLTKSLEDDADVIVWPEVAVTSFLANNAYDRIRYQEKLSDTYLITGIPERKYIDDKNESFNSSIILKPDGSFDTYQKIFLVPFAEYVPFFKSWINKMNQFDDIGSFTPGSNYKVFDIKDFKASILICYDSSSPQIVKNMVNNGAEILFIITNDSYVGQFMPYQHFELARLRAVEQRVPVIQSANTGISGIILPSGKIVYSSKLNERTVFTTKVPIYE